MRKISRKLRREVWKKLCAVGVAAAFAGTLMMGGCAARVRVYDPDYHDYHRWDSRENGYYIEWERETHREHRDFQGRDRDDQGQYWKWRHERHDHDHDRDHDHGAR